MAAARRMPSVAASHVWIAALFAIAACAQSKPAEMAAASSMGGSAGSSGDAGSSGSRGGSAGHGGAGSTGAVDGSAGAAGSTNDQDAALQTTDAGEEPDAAALEPRDAFECDALARQAIDSFYAMHGDRWELNVTKTDGLLAPARGDCSSNPDSGLTLEYTSDDLRLSIYVRCEGLHSASAADLNAVAPALALDRLPTGLEVAGCPVLFNALPPSSTVDDALEVVAIEATRIVLRARTRLFAVSGWNRDEDACPYIADAPALEQCYEQVRQDIMLDATFDLPFDRAAFESQL